MAINDVAFEAYLVVLGVNVTQTFTTQLTLKHLQLFLLIQIRVYPWSKLLTQHAVTQTQLNRI